MADSDFSGTTVLLSRARHFIWNRRARLFQDNGSLAGRDSGNFSRGRSR